MTWTTEQKIRYLLRQPWTVTVSSGDEAGERVLRVVELPAVVVGSTDEVELEREFWASLRATLEAYLHFGDPIPMPPRTSPLPWEAQASSSSEPRPEGGSVQVADGKTSELPATELQNAPSVDRELCTA